MPATVRMCRQTLTARVDSARVIGSAAHLGLGEGRKHADSGNAGAASETRARGRSGFRVACVLLRPSTVSGSDARRMCRALLAVLRGSGPKAGATDRT